MKKNVTKRNKQMKREWLLGVFLSISLCACNTANKNVASNPEVVATSTIIADLVAEIGQENIELTSILQPGVDPHVYEPTPSDSRVLETADVIFYNGYNLEPALIHLMNATGEKAPKIAVGEVVQPLQLEKNGEAKVPDPHVWGSAENAIQMVNIIRDELIKLSPEDEQLFQQRASELTDKLRSLHSWIREQVETIPSDKRQLITTHDAFQYYGEAYGLEIVGTLIGISTEEQPSAQTVSQLVESIKRKGVTAIFAESTINPALIKTVVQEAGVKLSSRALYSDSIGTEGSDSDSYIKMMVANTKTIVEALGGKYTPFAPEK